MIDNYPIQLQNHLSFNKNHYTQAENLHLDLVAISPSLYYGNLNSLCDRYFNNHNFKIIINCLPTYKFLNRLNDPSNKLSISTDVIVLLMDLGFDINQYSENEKYLLNDFTTTYNKVLQNFISFFVSYNENYDKHVHGLPHNLQLNLQQPILTGNLKNNLFKLNRIIKLFKNINSSIDVLVVGEFNENFSKALLISYLMDNYNYNINGCLHYLNYRIPINLNANFYNDLLILENLKKFYEENNEIKAGSAILYNNKQGKRGRDDDLQNCKRIRF